jgi:hypothetical protein
VSSHINEGRRDFRTNAKLTLHFLHSGIQFGLRLAKIMNVGQADVCLICANLPLEKVGGEGCLVWVCLQRRPATGCPVSCEASRRCAPVCRVAERKRAFCCTQRLCRPSLFFEQQTLPL